MTQTQTDPSFAPLPPHQVRVLLVDDQPIVGEAVRRMLAPEADIVFSFVPDPAKAIPAAREFKPTVMLLDLVMPDIDGLTLVRFMRADPSLKDIPLIVLSTKEEATTKAEAFGLGANDYLVKLPDRVELVARLRHHSRGYINLLERNEAYEALQRELDRAADYVRSLLPAPLDEPALKTTWRFIPSSSLGGDSFGYHWLDENRLVLYLLDVCDHGVGSALLSVTVANLLATQSLPGVDFGRPDAVLAALNNTFQMEKYNDLYFTMWYGVYDRAARTLTFASGGHPPALLLTATPDGPSHVEELRTRGLFVGGMPDTAYESATVPVPVPSRLLLFSDGVYELKKKDDGQMWTFEEFEEFMAQSAPGGAEAIDRLIARAGELQGSPSFVDDFSMVAFDFTG
jgi:sigma-B regulation protein RsbU (phosphoserine phosphatase)